jgi:hypothetical protein
LITGFYSVTQLLLVGKRKLFMKKKLVHSFILSFVFIISSLENSSAQNVGIGINIPDGSAILDITNTTKGLLIPRMKTPSILSITNPAKGLLVYDSLTNLFMVNTGTRTLPNWQSIGSGTAGNDWRINGNSGINPTNQFIGTTDNQPLRFRINNIQAGELNPVNGNIFWGLRAGQANTVGFSNIAIGTDALKVNTIRVNLVAIGDSALFHNKPDDPLSSQSTLNTAIGSKSLFSNTTGFANTAIGYQSLFANSNGTSNTAIGRESLFTNNTGSNNTAIGDQSLHSNTSGSFNTTVGRQSLFFNSTGSNNTAVGEESLISNTTGNDNTAVGSSSLSSSSVSDQNTAIGSESLSLNSTGSFNTATGYRSLHSNTTGNFNTAIGTHSLFSNKNGGLNTAIGYQALFSNIAGTDNTATGFKALFFNTSGDENTAIGDFALFSNTTGNINTAIGHSALEQNTTGTSNVAIGDNALSSLSGINGQTNTAIGNSAMVNTLGSSGNTAVGWAAGSNFNMGDKNIFIGAASDGNQNNLTNCVALGEATTCTASNQVRFGNSSTTSIGGIVGFSDLSDGRYKKNIQEKVVGIDFIMKLRPVMYQLDIAGINNQLNRKVTEDIGENAKTVFSGFIAQEVEQAAKDVNYDFGGIDKPKNEKDMYGLRYAEFVVPLVKAMQEQQLIIDSLRMQVEAVKAEIPMEIGKQQKLIIDLKNQNEDLQKRMAALEKKVSL